MSNKNKQTMFFTLVFLLMAVFCGHLSLEAQNLGDKWQMVYQNKGIPFRAMTYGGGKYVAVGDIGFVVTSNDGKNWTTRNSGTSSNLYGINYGNGRFVAVGYKGALLTSSDGVNWTPRNSALTDGLWAVAYSGTTFVIMGRNGAVASSPDGINWTKRNSGTTAEFRDVSWGNGLFVGAASSGHIFTSPDGINWTKQNTPTSMNLYCVIYSAKKGLWLAGGGRGALMTSPDGKKWTLRKPGGSNYFFAATYVDSTFFVACNAVAGDPSAPVYKSTDGISWTKVYTGSNSHLRSMASNGTSLCAGGDRRTIMHSDNTPVTNLTVFYPNGGESLTVGNNVSISWKTGGPANVKLQYSTNGGSTWSNITSSTANDGSYLWTVPNVPSTSCKVKVSDAADGSPADASNMNFTIKAPVSNITITITSPGGGENWAQGSQHNITWRGSKKFNSVDIEYFDGSQWNVIVTGTTDDGSYSWTVPNISTNAAKIWMKGVDGSTNPTDFSGTFTISGSGGGGGGGGGGGTPTIAFTSPNGGENWAAGSTQNITWSSSQTFSSVDIEYYDGSKWNVLVTGTADDGLYPWTVPSISTTGARMWIKGYDGSTNPTDFTDSTFTISTSGGDPGASITVTSPNGGEVLSRGTTKTIRWNSTGSVGNVKIFYSIDGGLHWSTITTSTANDGSYGWSVPNTTATNCLVKVTSTSNSSLSDTSDRAFSIGGSPQLVLDKSNFNFGALNNGAIPCTQTLFVYNGGGGSLNWSASSDAQWLTLSPASGNDGGIITVSVNPAGLAAGTHSATITVSASGVSNSPQTASVNFNIINSYNEQPPFGSFATPADGTANISGSVAVTGWVLDDICVESLKIYRVVGGAEYYIGDAVFAEGARPDVEAAYPGYPSNSRAGWGYMLLTNFVPDGQLVLKAVAKDSNGHTVSLGTKTVTVDNANAIKPFGAIDAPAQGGDAAGTNFRNNGWVLTPNPNKVPTDGSTINVYIDSVAVGKAKYNIYRSDIAGLFPGYANSNGSMAYFDFDTTAFSNGVHTIAWSVSDNAGNSAGVGSRYFTIQNTGGTSRQQQMRLTGTVAPDPGLISGRAPAHCPEPLDVSFGFGDDVNRTPHQPDENGVVHVRTGPLERMVIDLNEPSVGYLVVNDQWRKLPTGSTITADGQQFCWQPAPGFLGDFHLVFISGDGDSLRKKEVLVHVTPDSQ